MLLGLFQGAIELFWITGEYVTPKPGCKKRAELKSKAISRIFQVIGY
jgi:hypothetical protein